MSGDLRAVTYEQDYVNKQELESRKDGHSDISLT